MVPDGGRAFCATCPRVAHYGDSPGDVERREDNRLHALALLDIALAHQDEQRKHDQLITTEMEARMGQTIQTRGCSKCGSTMYRTVDVDDNGNPISVPTFICNNCGHMEG
ncbi:hypothetical protein [Streptomyces fulvorobeus]|nr:hypothetical protein [Streptomyces fulvorobeus]NYE44273.1 RNase P subunit RPR2 [Streptomyces fulvorobeus]